MRTLRNKKYTLFSIAVLSLLFVSLTDVLSFRNFKVSQMFQYLKELKTNITNELCKNTYTKEELWNVTFNYLQNVSGIHREEYLDILSDTLGNIEVPQEFDVTNVQNTWPTLIPKLLRIQYPNFTWERYRLPVITGKPFGRLGNVMGEYASLYALGRLYNATVLLHPDMGNILKGYFPSISMQNLPPSADPSNPTPDTDWITLHRQERDYNYSPLEFAASGLFGPNLFVFEEYPFEIPLFHALRDEIIKEFTFSSSLREEANRFLHTTKSKAFQKHDGTQITFIGFHIRRTDYVEHMDHFGGVLPGKPFFKRALQYYRSKFTYPIFIASSDERAYMQTNLNESDIYFVPGHSPECDMAILSACNHSIFTVGSFGFWGAYLAGGLSVYPNVATKFPYCFSKGVYESSRLNSFVPFEVN